MKKDKLELWKKCPLLMLVLASGIIISGISLANPGGIYENYEKGTVMTPALSVFFRGLKEGKYPWRAGEAAAPAMNTGSAMPPDGEGIGPVAADLSETEAGKEAEVQENDAGTDETAAPAEEIKKAGIDGQQGVFVRKEQKEEEQEEKRRLVLGPVEEEYFEDALFIGDSRTQGLFEYGGFSENVTFYSKTSLTVYDLFKKEKAFIKEDGKNITLKEALTTHSFKKIYLMVGINELGTGTAESFFEEYARVVYQIQSLQPDAILFVQGIMHVGEKKNASDKLFNNTNIEIRNVEIATLADNQNIFYLDVNEVLCDENGNLFDGWSNDQVHLKAKYYAVWKDFLMAHGAVEEPDRIGEFMRN